MENNRVEPKFAEIEIIDERLNDYNSNPNDVEDFDYMLEEIVKSL